VAKSAPVSDYLLFAGLIVFAAAEVIQ